MKASLTCVVTLFFSYTLQAQDIICQYNGSLPNEIIQLMVDDHPNQSEFFLTTHSSLETDYKRFKILERVVGADYKEFKGELGEASDQSKRKLFSLYVQSNGLGQFTTFRASQVSRVALTCMGF